MAGAHAAGAAKHAAPKGPKHAGPRAPKGATSSGVPKHSGGPRHAAPKAGPGRFDFGGSAQGAVNRGAQTVAKPVTKGFAFSASQTASFGKSAVQSGGAALPFLIVGTFAIVALAKFRGEGQNEVSIAKAFFGGIILAFFLTMLAQWNKRLATLFAGLVFLGVLLELGPVAFGGLFTDKTKPLSNGSGAAEFVEQQRQAVLGNPPPAIYQTPPGDTAAGALLNPNR